MQAMDIETLLSCFQRSFPILSLSFSNSILSSCCSSILPISPGSSILLIFAILSVSLLTSRCKMNCCSFSVSISLSKLSSSVWCFYSSPPFAFSGFFTFSAQAAFFCSISMLRISSSCSLSTFDLTELNT